MSATLIIWLFLVIGLVFLSFQRAAYAIALYLLTFFLAPPFWWWGSPVESYRWNLYAGVMLLVSVLFTRSDQLRDMVSKRFVTLAMLFVANATIVHFLLAPNAGVSAVRYVLMVKLMVLFLLMAASIKDERDLKIIVVAIVLGAAYIGYEVTINDRGRIVHNRLEGVGVPNAATANDLASLMVTCIPLVGPLFLFGKLHHKVIAALAGPFILNVVLMCNSRGAFLALILLGGVYLLASPKSLRPQIIKLSCLGLFAAWLLLGDPRIVERFMTTFDSAEERDTSAASRLDFWKAGLMMISDYPLGTGGDGFKRIYGGRYIAKVTGLEKFRSVHQGYINEACEWGIQGLMLRLAILGAGLQLAWRTSRIAIRSDQMFIACVSLSVIAGLMGLMAQSLFGTFLDDEWGLWLVTLAIGCNRLATVEQSLALE